MSTFEYVAIALTLIYSSAALRIIGALPDAAASGKRYSLHLIHVCALLFGIAAMFWAQLSFRDLDWTFSLLLRQLGEAGVLYYLATTLVTRAPEVVESWELHYFAVRRRYFLGWAAWACAVTLNTLLNGLPLFRQSRILHGVVLSIGVVGTTTDKRRVHWALVALILAGVLLTLFVNQRPDWADA